MDQKTTVTTFLDALADHDDDVMKPMLTEDIAWWAPPSVAGRIDAPRPAVGWSSIPWLGGGSVPQFKAGTTKYTYHHLVEEGDLVSVHMTRESEANNGAHYVNEYNWLIRLSDGKIAEVWEVLDTAHAFSTLGMKS